MGRLKRKQKPLRGHTLKKKHSPILKKLALAFAIVLVATGLYVKIQPHTKDAKIRVELESKSQQLKITKDELQKTQAQSEQQQIEQQKKLDEVNKQLEETKKQLEAKRNSATAYAAEAPQPSVVSVVNCGDNVYKQYIYQHESGCRTDAVNSIGCTGIGQACPGSKIRNVCPDLNFACQDAWFSNYAIQRYGSWAGAYQFWVNNHWW
ncbi:hypothetical protein UFOVP1439_41 [uncultured Caudovirales phage]|uniref:Transglycosylase SLT domain-containing protein n=1 Tax=uncultured Caudovirales phage TaxID=2100421 RepID=A0A6J5QDI0_9CAUD|nr:hypothetical protein UFOVP1085_21 [uncultured Caudovirales phage]CAB4212801.1 hypothetical protein UFOVP1439_41 [uncultured Caudovirales phage]